MSAPTPAAGDGSPAPGYYPDPSIPGYVRYWNGAAWVPGTSRPAPAGAGAAPTAPAQDAAAPSVEETGPVFLDEDPEQADPEQAAGAQEPASAWQADASRQGGFGGGHDHRVSWGAPPASVPEPRAGGTADEAPVQEEAAPQEMPRRHGGGIPSSLEVPQQALDSTAALRALEAARRAREEATGEGAAGSPETALSVRSAPAAGAREGRGRKKGTERQSAPEAAPARADEPAAPGVGPAALTPAQHTAPPPAALPASPPPAAGALPAAPSAPVPAVAPPRNPAPAAAFPAGSTPGAAPWAQQVRELARTTPPAAPGAPFGGAADGPVAPWKPPVDDPFVRAAREQASARPAGLGRRLAARLVDTVVLGVVVGAVALPLATRAHTHVDGKIQAARLSGRTVTVWLVDGTTGVYLLAVLAVLLVAGLLYEALPTAKWGRTLGKKLCGVQVRDIESFDTPRFGRAVTRWLVYGVLGVLAIGVVNVVWCLFDRPWRQCWHDKAARTFVAGPGTEH